MPLKDSPFLMPIYRLNRLLEYLHNPVTRDPAFSVLLGLMVRELHIGTCRAPPESVPGFADEVFEMFQKLLQDKRYISAAIYVSVTPHA